MSNWVVGHNMVGYLPESDPWVTSDHEAAKQSLVDDLERFADQAEDGGDHTEAEALTEAAEELSALPADTEWGTVVGYTSFWLNATDEEPEEEE